MFGLGDQIDPCPEKPSFRRAAALYEGFLVHWLNTEEALTVPRRCAGAGSGVWWLRPFVLERVPVLVRIHSTARYNTTHRTLHTGRCPHLNKHGDSVFFFFFAQPCCCCYHPALRD
ncbi:hypothetical protein ACKS23_00585 [Histoplasma ohiense]